MPCGCGKKKTPPAQISVFEVPSVSSHEETIRVGVSEDTVIVASGKERFLKAGGTMLATRSVYQAMLEQGAAVWVI